MQVSPSPGPTLAGSDLRLRWLGGVILVILACMAMLPWIGSRAANATMATLTAVATEERAYERLLDMLTDAETGQRGYVITGNRAFLAPYDSGVAAIPAALRDLDVLADIPQERATVNAIRELTEKKLDLLAAAIRFRARDGFEPAARVIATGEGKVYMDRLRALIGERQTVLAGQRAALRQRMRTTLDYNGILGLAASAASAVVICFALILAGRGLRERGEAAEQARQLGAAQAAQARSSGEQNQRLAVIAQMLQAMDSLLDAGELAGVLPVFLPRLLPGSHGAVYLFRDSRDFLQRCAAWGEDGVHPERITPADCRALRFGRTHLAHGPRGLRCVHRAAEVAASADAGEQLCVPMISQGEVIGLLVAAMPAGPEAATEQAAVDAIAGQLALGTSNINLREMLRRQSTTDELTGLYDRRYFDAALRRELFRAERHQKPLAIVMIDLDHFEHINDTHGHDAGNAVLRAAGRCLHDGVRRSDIACRYGGEALALVLPECDAAAAVRCADAVRSAIAALTLTHRDRALPRVTASCGVAAWPAHGADADALLQAADSALYAAKNEGRDRVCVA